MNTPGCRLPHIWQGASKSFSWPSHNSGYPNWERTCPLSKGLRTAEMERKAAC